MKYIHLLKQAIADQFTAPSDQFVKALIKNIYTGTKTQNLIDKFKELTLVAMNEYTSDLLNEKLQNAMVGYHTQPIIQTQEKELDFLPFELKTMDYIRDSMNLSDLTYKKTTYYAYAYIRTQNRWVFRVSVQKNKNLFTLHKFEDTDYETEYYFDEPETLEQIRTLIENTYERCKNI